MPDIVSINGSIYRRNKLNTKQFADLTKLKAKFDKEFNNEDIAAELYLELYLKKALYYFGINEKQFFELMQEVGFSQIVSICDSSDIGNEYSFY